LALHAKAATFADPAVRTRADRLFAELRQVSDVARVVDPFTQRGRVPVSADRRTAVATVQFRQPTDEIPTASVDHVMSLVAAARNRVLDTGLAGQAIENAQSNKTGAGEGIALLAAIIVLLISFGSAAAVGMTLASTMLALGVGFGAMSLVSHLVPIPTFATQIATTIGLGVGIDYALLVLARYRNATQGGLGPQAATVAAMRTAGRAVVFAGSTVMLAMLGLYLVGLPFIDGLGLGVVLVVVPTVLTATTVLPAILGHAGGHLDRWRPPGMRRRQLTGRSSGWARWAARVQRRPVIAMGLSFGLLALLAAPALSIRLGNAEASTDDRSTTSHRAYAYASQSFGAGYTRPFEVVATLPPHLGAAKERIAARDVRRLIGHTTAVGAVSGTALDATGRHALLTVYSAASPTAPQTSALLQRLRGPVRAALARDGVDIAVGGPAAIGFDLSRTISTAVPLVLAAVIGTSLLLLLVLFRSVIVALKAGLMNLLAIGAAFGVVVAVFQHGWGLHVIGVDYAGPIEVFLPILLFPTVFGLSMDYEVFLLSRIRDEWDRTHDNRFAVAEGLATTGRVVTAGAAIMIVLFGSLVFADARTVKVFGLGLSIAILLDAVVVRSVLLPATMQLLGRINWWLPRWLDRLMPHLSTEAPPTEDAPVALDPATIS
jgi:RND superfamily putative drug exporter